MLHVRTARVPVTGVASGSNVPLSITISIVRWAENQLVIDSLRTVRES